MSVYILAVSCNLEIVNQDDRVFKWEKIDRKQIMLSEVKS